MENYFDILKWDSSFFGLKVSNINAKILDNIEFDNILNELKNQEVKLGYYSSVSPLNINQFSSDLYEIFPVDKKITYFKNIEENSPSNQKIFKYEENYPNDKLINLAIQSGIYSRFNIDKKIGRIKFEELYKEWIIKSVSKILATEVLVYRDNDVIEGFVTLGEKLGVADIGIIAVDEYSRGKGIGKKLMASAENWFAINHYNQIQVVTQGDNLPACKLYEACGFNINKVEYFYHFWRKESDTVSELNFKDE